jgi:DNA-binding protein WhiA
MCCALAECYGILLFANTFTNSRFKLITENDKVFEYILQSFEKLFNIYPKRKQSKNKSGNIYFIEIDNHADINKILLRIPVDFSSLSISINHTILNSECCRNAFLRGAFLVGGTITDPKKAYHFELSTHRKKLSKEIFSFLQEYDELSPKALIRKSNNVIYFKDSNEIEDLLNILGATKSAFEYINMKIEKQLRNDANRIANCESANIDKIVNAAQNSIMAINELKSSGRFEFLSDDLKTIANLRLNNPEASLKELGDMVTPAIGKTAVYNKINKIIKQGMKEISSN